MPIKGQQRLGSTGLGMSLLEGQLRLDEIVMIQTCGGKDDEFIRRRMLKMELPGKRRRGMPKRFVDMKREDMQA